MDQQITVDYVIIRHRRRFTNFTFQNMSYLRLLTRGNNRKDDHLDDNNCTLHFGSYGLMRFTLTLFPVGYSY